MRRKCNGGVLLLLKAGVEAHVRSGCVKYPKSLFGFVFLWRSQFMNSHTTAHDFNSVLNNIIDERFPNTERYIVSGGDYFKDVIIELRESGKELRYSPYELFEKSQNYEDTIEEFIVHWQTMLQQ